MPVAANRGLPGGQRNVKRAQRFVRQPRPVARPRPAPPPNFPRYVPSRPGQIPQRPARPPTQRQVRIAVAQRKAIVSSHRAVPKEARRQRQAVAQYKRTAPGRYYVSLGKSVEKQANIHNAANRIQRNTGVKTKVVGNQIYKQHKRSLLGVGLKSYWTPVKASGAHDPKAQTRELARQTALQATEPSHVAAQKGLGYLARPSHAGAAAAEATIKHKDVSHAVSQALQGKTHTGYGEVLKDIGVHNKTIRGVGGAVLDVGLDPLTYVGGGTGSLAEKAAAKAARQAERQAARVLPEAVPESVAREAQRAGEQARTRTIREGSRPKVQKAKRERPKVEEQARQNALKGGATRKQADAQARKAGQEHVNRVAQQARADLEESAAKRGRQAAERHVRQARQTRIKTRGQAAARKAREGATGRQHARGITVAIGGKEIPLVRRATSGARHVTGQATRAVARKAGREDIVDRTAAASRAGLREVAPSVRPGGIDRGLHEAGRGAQRKARAQRANLQRKAERLTSLLRRKLPEDTFNTVIDAIERNDLGRIKGLDADAMRLVHDLRSVKRGARRFGRRAGVGAAETIGTGRFLSQDDQLKLSKTIGSEINRQHQGLQSVEAKEADAAVRRTTIHRDTAETRLDQARNALKRELAKPVGQRRGVAVLEHRVAVARRTRDSVRLTEQAATRRGAHETKAGRLQRVRHEQTAVTEPRPPARKPTEIVDEYTAAKRQRNRAYRARVKARADVKRATAAGSQTQRAVAESKLARAQDDVSAANARYTAAKREVKRNPPPEPPPDTARAAKATARHEERRAQTAAQQARLVAAHEIPKRGVAETDGQFLRRVIEHADQHGLQLVGERARKLLAAQPHDVARGYFPHEFEDRVLKKLGIKDRGGLTSGFVGRGPRRTVPKITASYARSDPRRLAEINPELRAAGQPEFSTNVPAVVLNHLREIARAASVGEFAKEIAGLGRRLKPGEAAGDGEQVYKLGYQGGSFGLHAVPRVPEKFTKGGQYVALPSNFYEGLLEEVAAHYPSNVLAKAWDRSTGGFKRAALGWNLAYHVHNLIGDTEAAYRAHGNAMRLIPNAIAASRAVARHSERTRTLRPGGTDSHIRVGGELEHVDDFLQGAVDNGVLNVGKLGGEVKELGEYAGQRKVRKRTVRDAVDRWSQNRENLMRLATYKDALDRGLSQREAADWANKFHIDYGELSGAERKFFRRVAPFYTWTARSLPVVAKGYVKRPGKLANLQLLREDLGFNEDAAKRVPDYVLRKVPFALGWGSAISGQLPETLLNEVQIPTSGHGLAGYLGDIFKTTMTMANPLLRVPFELGFGKSSYTGRDIEPTGATGGHILVPAPQGVGSLPQVFKDFLHVKKGPDPDNPGKKIWLWRGKADYAYRQLHIGAAGQLADIGAGGRAGATGGRAQAALGIAGLGVDPLNKKTLTRAKRQHLQDLLSPLYRQRQELNDQGIHADSGNAKYLRLLARIRNLEGQKDALMGKKSGSGGGSGILKGSGSGGGILSSGSGGGGILG